MTTRFLISPPSLPSRHGNQRHPLDATLDQEALHLADAASVVLLLDNAALERRPVTRLQRVAEASIRRRHRHTGAQHAADVLSMALVVLLPVRVADARPAFHDDPGPCTVDAGLPRAVVANPLAVLAVVRVLAEVPDVAALVLCVPVVRLLRRFAAGGGDIEDDDG